MKNKDDFEKDLKSALEAMTIESLDEIVGTNDEPVKNSTKNVRIRAFLYQVCQNDTPEWFIVEHLLQGFTLDEVGKLLGITKHGVRYHLGKLSKRLQATTLSVSDVI